MQEGRQFGKSMNLESNRLNKSPGKSTQKKKVNESPVKKHHHNNENQLSSTKKQGGKENGLGVRRRKIDRQAAAAAAAKANKDLSPVKVREELHQIEEVKQDN